MKYLDMGLLLTLLNDPTVSEIMVNGADNVYVERSGKIEKNENTFRDDLHVYAYYRKDYCSAWKKS